MEYSSEQTAFFFLVGIFFASFFGTFLVMVVYTYTSSAQSVVTAPSDPLPVSSGTDTPMVPPDATTPQTTQPIPPAPLPHAPIFVYSFNAPGILKETSRATDSSSPYWFLDSGGKFIVTNGIGETLQGALPVGDTWRTAYARTSAQDTDDGLHPQNLFRLLTKTVWENAHVELSFRITADNVSDSPNRNASNGLLLMSRYQDHDTLYYAGIRVDGTAIIKKKYHGIYYTMAQIPVFSGVYDRTQNPNLLPENTWLRLRVDTLTNSNQSVTVTLSQLQNQTSTWKTLVSATDDGVTYGGTPAITAPGLLGVRTDFMDVLFSNFKAENAL